MLQPRRPLDNRYPPVSWFLSPKDKRQICLDWRHQGEHIKTEPGILYEIDAVDLINVRIGLQAERWSVQGFVNNIADEQFPIDPASFGAFFLRDYSDPRAAGVEVSYRF